LLRAVEGYARFRMPMVYGDPRVALAHNRLARGGRAAAWETFEPVYREVVGSEDGSAFALQPGLLLLEAPSMVRDLLDAAPPPVSRSNALSQLEALLAAWNTQAADEPAASVGPLGRLTDRELEVLSHVASGAGNKHIARALDLSLHTVKRHIANILEKLDCASRGQAADLYRRHSPA
jgi:LuxR family maltose regulon positive regulatory protein